MSASVRARSCFAFCDMRRALSWHEQTHSRFVYGEKNLRRFCKLSQKHSPYCRKCRRDLKWVLRALSLTVDDGRIGTQLWQMTDSTMAEFAARRGSAGVRR